MTDGVYYLFDCLDGLIGDKLLTLEELRGIMTNDPRPYTEKDAKEIAYNYEAELYRYTYKDGKEVECKKLVELMW